MSLPINRGQCAGIANVLAKAERQGGPAYARNSQGFVGCRLTVQAASSVTGQCRKAFTLGVVQPPDVTREHVADATNRFDDSWKFVIRINFPPEPGNEPIDGAILG